MVNYIINIKTEKEWHLILELFKDSEYYTKDDFKTNFSICEKLDTNIGIEITNNKINGWCRYQWFLKQPNFNNYIFTTVAALIEPPIYEIW